MVAREILHQSCITKLGRFFQCFSSLSTMGFKLWPFSTGDSDFATIHRVENFRCSACFFSCLKSSRSRWGFRRTSWVQDLHTPRGQSLPSEEPPETLGKSMLVAYQPWEIDGDSWRFPFRHRATPSSHPFLGGIFHETKTIQRFWGYPHDELETTIWRCHGNW